MNARERAVVETMLPSGAVPGLPGALESGFEEFLARFDRTALPKMRLGFRAALWAASWISPLLIRRLPPLSRLAPQERVGALEAMGVSRSYYLRQMSLLLKAVLSFHYGAHEKVRDAIGFPK